MSTIICLLIPVQRTPNVDETGNDTWCNIFGLISEMHDSGIKTFVAYTKSTIADWWGIDGSECIHYVSANSRSQRFELPKWGVHV